MWIYHTNHKALCTAVILDKILLVQYHGRLAQHVACAGI